MPTTTTQRRTCQATIVRGLGGDAGQWQALVAHLPAGWAERARACGALQRRRAVRSGADLLRLVLGVAVQGWSLRLAAGWAEVQGIASLSDVALWKRLRHSRAWLSEEVGRLLGVQRQRWAGRAVRVRLVDATTVTEPGSRGTNWRVHAVLDLQANTLHNRRTGATFPVKPLGDAGPVIDAGGLFNYARQTGMIPDAR